MLKYLFVFLWIGSIFFMHFWYIVYNIQIFEGLKCSNMFVFRRQYLIEIRTIHLNLIPHLGKVCSCGVEMLAKLKCWNKFGICYEYNAAIFWWAFRFYFMKYRNIRSNVGQIATWEHVFYFVIVKLNNTCSS